MCSQALFFAALGHAPSAIALLTALRWPDGVVCLYCGSRRITGNGSYWRDPNLPRYACKACGRTFMVTTRTPLARSRVALETWIRAAWLVVLHQSANQCAKETGLSFDRAYTLMWWFLEAAVGFEIDRKLSGVVEADEIYVSAGHKGKKPAKVRNGSSPSRAPRHRGVRRGRGRGHAQKDRPVVVVKRQRKGPVCSSAAADVTDETVKRLFRERVAPGSTVYTDSAKCYRPLGGEGYTLEQVNHSRGEYARGEQNEIHENGAEGEISLLKPFLGVYRGVSQRNLPSYLLFYQFQRNHRDLSRWEQAAVLMAALLGNGPAPCCLLPPLWAHSFEECTVGCHTSSE